MDLLITALGIATAIVVTVASVLTLIWRLPMYQMQRLFFIAGLVGFVFIADALDMAPAILLLIIAILTTIVILTWITVRAFFSLRKKRGHVPHRSK